MKIERHSDMLFCRFTKRTWAACGDWHFVFRTGDRALVIKPTRAMTFSEREGLTPFRAIGPVMVTATRVEDPA